MKNKNQLERFIRDNREAFDTHEPSLDLWAKIEQQLPPVETKVIPLLEPKQASQSSFRFGRWQLAASVVLVATIGLFAWNYLSKPTVAHDPDIAQVNPDYAKAAFRYASVIETKRNELRQLETEDPELYQTFAAEIEKLDQDYAVLKAELPNAPNPEMMVEAMIQNRQRQIDLLNTQLNIIQNIKQTTSHENHTKQDTVI
ncbi:MAG: hypothetical protein U0Y10_01720 [Spirosomataceae bacterium]